MVYRDLFSRRQFVRNVAFGAAALTTPGLFAQELMRTPRQTEGPFYPDKYPLDTDNDLLIVNDSITPAVGEVTHLSGRITSASGEPVRNALIEIWQVDGRGNYLHSRGASNENRDANFQGFGRFLTGSSGEYYFRTIKPVAYPGRTPHIHFAVDKAGHRMLTTQMYVAGEPRNDRDGLYRSLPDDAARRALTVAFQPVTDSTIGELSARFDIVVGQTPEDIAVDGFRARRRPPQARGFGPGQSRPE